MLMHTPLPLALRHKRPLHARMCTHTQGPVGKDLINKAKKEEHAVVLRTGHRVPTHMYNSKGQSHPLKCGAHVVVFNRRYV